MWTITSYHGWCSASVGQLVHVRTRWLAAARGASAALYARLTGVAPDLPGTNRPAFAFPPAHHTGEPRPAAAKSRSPRTKDTPRPLRKSNRATTSLFPSPPKTSTTNYTSNEQNDTEAFCYNIHDAAMWMVNWCTHSFPQSVPKVSQGGKENRWRG